MHYETEQDRQNAAASMQALAQLRGYNGFVSARPHADFVAYAGVVPCAVVEVKTRTVSSVAYPTLKVGLKKLLAVQTYAATLGVTPFMIVRWTDRTGCIDLSVLNYDGAYTARSGRTDRNDPNDTETCLFIPIRHFTWFV